MDDDALLPFAVEPLDVRGRLVRLGPELDGILSRHGYPAPVAALLAEAAALTALLAGSVKEDLRFQLQTQSDGPVSMLVVDVDAPDKLRAYARFDAEAIAAAATPAELLGRGHLALTVDPGRGAQRYQGVVSLENDGLTGAADRYFRQSEQIPTFIRLAVGAVQRGPAAASWRAGGLFLQFLPEAPERVRQRDLDPGDAPAGTPRDERPDDDAWTEAQLLARTVQSHELLDPMLPATDLLMRLFHEHGVRVFGQRTLRAACRCSEERITGMLARFTAAERRDMHDESGRIRVTCAFCSRVYLVDPASLGADAPQPGA